jgi:hypothetical protein
VFLRGDAETGGIVLNEAGANAVPPVRAALQSLLEGLLAATADYLAAAGAEDTARRQTTTALNKLNEAQKRVDEALGLLREEAPRDSDWARRRNYPNAPVKVVG